MLRIEGLSTGYSARPVLSGVSINVEAGQFVAIVGPNGAGKTTLFKTISGILKPSAGTITFEGHDLLSTPPARRPHLGIAHVPGGTPGVSIADRDGKPRNGRDDRSRTARLEQTISSASLNGFRCWPSAAPSLPERLSGGQQQMLAIGRGLASSPKLLMLDEPSMGLRPTTADLIFDRLIEIRRQTRLTILLVEQRVAEALESADHGYVLEAGRVALEGDKQTLRADDRVRRALSRDVEILTNESAKKFGRINMKNRTSKGLVTRRTVLSGAAALGLSGVARAQAPAEVKVGLIVPLSGIYTRPGQVMRMGAEMGIEHINAQGGVKALGGAKLKLVIDRLRRHHGKGQERRAAHGGAGNRSRRRDRLLSELLYARRDRGDRARANCRC